MFPIYPYINVNDLNLDYLLKTIKDLQNVVENFVALNVVKYADPIQWSITRQYEKNTIVIDTATGKAYVSVDAVPSGVDINNTDYWTIVFDLEELFDKIQQNYSENVEDGDTSTNDYEVGQWILWKDVLYFVISSITAGDAFVIDSNIKRITVEERVENEYYPDDELLVMHGTTKNGSITLRGDYHIYDSADQAIKIVKI